MCIQPVLPPIRTNQEHEDDLMVKQDIDKSLDKIMEDIKIIKKYLGR